MPRRYLIVLLAATAALAQESTPALTKEQIAGATVDEALSYPMPGELFAALGKSAKPDWTAFFREPIPTNLTGRPQIAMNLGGLIADGYLAVEAMDGQQVKNIARDFRTLANALGIGQNLLNRGNSISEFVEGGKWEALREMFEAAQIEVIDAMNAHDDRDLVTFFRLGGWVRATHVISGAVSKTYSAPAARILRQPGIARSFTNKLAAMPEKTRDIPLVKKVRLTLFELHKAVSFPGDTVPSPEEVQALHALAATMIADISRKEP